MTLNCPAFLALNGELSISQSHFIIRKGYFYRKSDSRWIQRFRCKTCGHRFSKSTFSPRYYQKVRRINAPLAKLLVSGVTQARAALILKVDPKTVARRTQFLKSQAVHSQNEFLKTIPPKTVSLIQFDDLETSIHTRCKPVSVALAVEPKSRKILGFQVSQMPAKGRLAAISRKKYGIRKDLRPGGWNQLWKSLAPMVSPQCEVTTDENPHYPKWIKRHVPDAIHIQVPGGRGAISGQGELRDKRFDPMFSLNHTCAMLRANISRLIRRTWSTSKRIDRLSDHIAIYVDFHNRVLTGSSPIFGGSSNR